jgi:mannose-6-phosphate isomerase
MLMKRAPWPACDYHARMDLLRPVVKPYAWGSTDAIAQLQGRPVPAPGPEAELWMGAHPSAPSGLGTGGPTLDKLIAADPERELGADCVAQFGPRLPFLLKVLSAATALSIQVHPSRAQAQAGFAAERDLAADDPGRNYADDWPKPELLLALTPFEVAAGLRTPAGAAALLRALDVRRLDSLAATLEAAPSGTAATPASAAGERAMAEALAAILEWPASDRTALVDDVTAACAHLASSDGPHAAACAAVVRVAAEHPGDLGVVALLLMRHAILEPGQAVFMPAGGLHAYLRGTGIELLANSDNVVRAGLTGKHLDVPELLKLLDPAVEVPIHAPRVISDGISWYETPAPEFRLYKIDLTAAPLALPGEGPRILLCLHGHATLSTPTRTTNSAPSSSTSSAPSSATNGAPSSATNGAPSSATSAAAPSGPAPSGATLELSRGESCFVSAADGPIHATGPASLILATPGLPASPAHASP